jgi:hypothetical protein
MLNDNTPTIPTPHLQVPAMHAPPLHTTPPKEGQGSWPKDKCTCARAASVKKRYGGGMAGSMFEWDWLNIDWSNMDGWQQHSSTACCTILHHKQRHIPLGHFEKLKKIVTLWPS